MKKVFFLALIFIFAAGCVTQRKCLQKFPLVSSTDSVYIETNHEVPVYLPGDTITIDIPVDCPDQELTQVEFSKLRQQLLILHGRLVSKITIKPDTVRVTVKETETRIKEVKVPQPVKYTPKIYKYALWGWIIALAAGTVILVKKVFKINFSTIIKRLLNG